MKIVHLLLVAVISFCWISNSTIAERWDPIEKNPKMNEESRKILFIGNSYTFFNDLDIVLKKLAASAIPHMKLQTARLAKGGATLEGHYADPNVTAIISKVKWDMVVLQEQSTRPVEKTTAFFEYARKMGAIIEKQGAKPIFFMTWAREHKPDMTEPLAHAYTQMGREMDAFVAPVGLAWAASLEVNPKIRLYDEDQSHPNVHGTYLTACVFYATLTGQSPIGLSNAGLSEVTADQAQALQATAWETVQSYVCKQSGRVQK